MSQQQPPVIIILAGGAGKRMRSATTPKVLQPLAGKPMILHVLETAAKLFPERILVVIPPDDQIPAAIKQVEIHPTPEFVVQPTPQGTADAVRHCLPHLPDPNQTCLILSGDVPLIRPTVLHRLMQVECSLLVANVPNPRGYGRIVFGADDRPARIIEEKDCTTAVEAAIATVNCGVYHAPTHLLAAALPHIRNENSSREYYLTDLVSGNFTAVWLEEAELGQIHNVNTPEDLAAAMAATKTSINNPA